MTRYENLICYAEKLGAEVIETDFGTNKKIGWCIGNRIYINDQMIESQKYEVLSEEIGHYKTTFGNITNLDDVRNRKEELKARRYGYKLLIAPSDIVNAMKNGCNNKYEIAEYLNIAESFLDELIEDYKRQYGIGVYVGKYFLQFEPSLGLTKDFGGLFKYR